MKKIILTAIAFAALTINVWAQSPEAFKYQAVVRDASQSVLSNQAVGMQFTLLQGSASGTVVYQETFAQTSNAYGLVNLEIGKGTVVSGTFATIDWSAGPYFIETAMDAAGGTSYVVMGTSQLLSSPYALYAKTSGSSTAGPQGPAGADGTPGSAGADGAPQDAAGVTALGFTSGAHTTKYTDAEAVSAVGAHTEDTDTHIDSVGIDALGFSSGAHTTKYTDAEAVTAVGAHTVDNDTQLDAAGVTALGFTSGAHTTKYTDAEAVTAVGAHTAEELPTTGNSGDMNYWNGSAWITLAATPNEGATLQMISGVPTWTGGVAPTPTPSVTSVTGRVWMDRNLGASQVATAKTDPAAAGYLYQWGRGTDGHQIRTSSTRGTSSATDVPGHADFILTGSDWRSTQNDNLWQGVNGTNNPCPAGYRIPTGTEWEAERLTWSTNDLDGAFASLLKIAAGGSRTYNQAALINTVNALLWASTVSTSHADEMYITDGTAYVSSMARGWALSVRCIKD
jgi:hypothetical protein